MITGTGDGLIIYLYDFSLSTKQF